ncbi:MAG: ExeA family protein [Acidiferrobacteraceae bacterium]
MNLERFRFTSAPFSKELRVDGRLKLDFIEHELKCLKAVVDDRRSAAIVAPAGVGKSVTLRALMASLPEIRYKVHYFKLTDISARDLCRQVALFIGAAPAGSFPALVRGIEERFRAGYDGGGMRQLLIFDDAHEMRPDGLRLLRLLTNFDMDSRHVISIILAGQPPLKRQLTNQENEDIHQRLAHFGELRPLTRDESKTYVDHRLKLVGAARPVFSPQALEALYEVTSGNMRAIDEIARAALSFAGGEGRDIVEPVDVATARARRWK